MGGMRLPPPPNLKCVPVLEMFFEFAKFVLERENDKKNVGTKLRFFLGGKKHI